MAAITPPPIIPPIIPADNATSSPPAPPVGTASAVPPAAAEAEALSPPPPSSPPSSGLSKQALAALVAGIGLGGLIVLIGVGIFVFFYKRNKRRRAENSSLLAKSRRSGKEAQPPENVMVHELKSVSDPPPGIAPIIQSPREKVSVVPKEPPTSSILGSDKSHPTQPSWVPNSTFTYEELALATDNFSNSNLLGQGGFGYVYKGVLPPNGKEIAVKQLKPGSTQGEREFQAEVETISRVHHRHLVSLVGYCISGEQRMLVYEFIPNKTLEFHLHGEGQPPMRWVTRLKVALGSAKGLAYLHEDCHPKIIHRDIKASNILLNNDFEAKVADFGLAKFSFDTDTHVSTRVLGTFGYLAPEYASSGQVTTKSDVFSFGVVLLELITGHRPTDKPPPFMDDNMVEWAKPLLAQALKEGGFDGLVDPRLEDYDASEMAQMVACAAVCVRGSPRRRPQMSQVVRALEGNLSSDDLLKKIEPDNKTFHESSDYDSSTLYKEEVKKSRKVALKSQDVSTSEVSLFTNEHVAPPSTSSTENQHDTQEIETRKSNTGTVDVLEIQVE